MKLTIKKLSGFILAAVFSFALLPLPVSGAALVVEMTAEETTVTMPGGEEVTMWGYSIDVGSPHGDSAAYGTPFDLDNGVPVIQATTLDTLDISLTNSLPTGNPALVVDATSIVIPGQNATSMVPVFWSAGLYTGRVRSFTHETANTATSVYSWTSLKAGTYLIQSGTHPGVQVPMGLYAVLLVTDAGNAYPDAGVGAIGYDKEVVLLFSEIDPLQHLAIAGDPAALPTPIPSTYGTAAYMTTMSAGYEPRYFMINGKPYSSDQSPIATEFGLVGTPDLVANEDILLRFLNAGLETRQPVLNGEKFTVIAEDGNAFKPANGVQQQYPQYSLDLPPGKTMDVIFSPVNPGYYTIYDRRLALVNDTVKDGGMISMLQIGAAPRTLDVVIDLLGTGTGDVQMVSAPGGIDTAAGDLTEDLLDGAEVTLRATGDGDSTLTGWTATDSVGVTGECTGLDDCVVTMDDDKTVTATFTNFTLLNQVQVLTPNGGENIPSGSGLTIRWGAPATDMTFSLAYSFGAGTPWLSIATGVTGNQYVWTVPAGLPDKGPLFIAVTGYDGAGLKTTTDVSDLGALRYANALTAPNGAENWPTDPPLISWNSGLVPGTVTSIGLWYRTAPATPWSLITVLQSDSGNFDWAPTLPADVSATAEVGIIFYDALGDPLYIDISDNTFNLN